MVMIPTEELCQYLDDVKTVDDVKDIYQHFLLYWGRYVGDCQVSTTTSITSSTGDDKSEIIRSVLEQLNI